MRSSRRQFLTAAGVSLAAFPLVSQSGQHPTTSAPPRGRPFIQLNIRDYGAAADGSTKDTLAFQQAIDRANAFGGGEVFIPQGDYLIGAIALRSNVHLRLDPGASLMGSADLTDYPLTQVRWEGRWVKGHSALINSTDTKNIAITGTGRIIGSSAIPGRLDKQTGLRHPALLEFTNCTNIVVIDCVTEQNEMWSIHPVCCETVTFRNVTVRGGADGIDIDSCKTVMVDNCNFSTGDDCISLKSGRGAEGYALAHVTEDVCISNCVFADTNWACIGIGSETSGGIRNVHIEHCRCTEAHTFAIYIKTRPGRGAFIEDIFVDDLEVSNARQGFLRINLLDSGKQDEFPVPGDQGIPAASGFHFNNIRVNNVPILIQATSTVPSKPIQSFTLTNITGSCDKGIFLANIRGAELSGIQLSDVNGPLLSAVNVTGKGIDDAAPLDPTPSVAPLPRLVTPYRFQ
jgi:polygalacturonase